MDQFQITPELQQQRQEADKAAMVRALLGQQMPEAAVYPDFASRYAGDVAPLEHANRQFVAGPNNMVDPLIDLGFWHRHQGSYPPARYPSHYDWKK